MLYGTTRHLYIHGWWAKGYQSIARLADVGKYLMGVKVCQSLLNCDIDGEEIILELPDFMHRLVRVFMVSKTIQLSF